MSGVKSARMRVPGDLGPLGAIAVAYVGLLLLGAIAGFADDYIAAWGGERFTLRLRTRVFAHVHCLSAGDLDRRRVGDLVSRVSGDVAAIESVAVAGVAELLSAVFRILFFAGALVYLDWSLALVALVMARCSGSPRAASRAWRRAPRARSAAAAAR